MAQRLGKTVICTECHAALARQGRVKRSFLGFGRYSCPQCGKEFKSPLPRSYIVTYWIAAVGIPVGCVVMGVQSSVEDLGDFASLAEVGIVYICIIIALVRDASLKKKVRHAWQEHERKATDIPQQSTQA